MKLSKQHFELVASVLHGEYRRAADNFPGDIRLDTIEKLAKEFASRFRETNPQFNEDKFFAAVREGTHIRKGLR